MENQLMDKIEEIRTVRQFLVKRKGSLQSTWINEDDFIAAHNELIRIAAEQKICPTNAGASPTWSTSQVVNVVPPGSCVNTTTLPRKRGRPVKKQMAEIDRPVDKLNTTVGEGHIQPKTGASNGLTANGKHLNRSEAARKRWQKQRAFSAGHASSSLMKVVSEKKSVVESSVVKRGRGRPVVVKRPLVEQLDSTGKTATVTRSSGLLTEEEKREEERQVWRLAALKHRQRQLQLQSEAGSSQASSVSEPTNILANVSSVTTTLPRKRGRPSKKQPGKIDISINESAGFEHKKLRRESGRGPVTDEENEEKRRIFEGERRRRESQKEIDVGNTFSSSPLAIALSSETEHEGGIAQEGLQHEIESILGAFKMDKKLFYLVKWKGFEASYNTWDARSSIINIPGAANCIDKFLTKFGKVKTGRPKIMSPEGEAWQAFYGRPDDPINRQL